MNLPRLWICTARPNQLVNALAAVVALRERFSECNFVYERSTWWKGAQWEEYARMFGKIVALDRVTACRGIFDVPRARQALRARQEQLLGMGVMPGDVFLCLASPSGMANTVASMFPKHRKIFCCTRKVFEECRRPVDFLRYRFTTTGALEYFYLFPALGLRRTFQLKPWISRGGDGARIKRPAHPLEETFDAVIIWSNQNQPDSRDDLPAHLQMSPFPDLRDFAGRLPRPESEMEDFPARKKVVFFGTPFLLVRNLAPEEYAQMLNQCLDYLRTHYSASCQLVYRPHPAETRESSLLDLTGFDCEVDQEAAELYFLRNFAHIEAVYSVSSSVSRVAFNNGFNAYAFWPCFPFPESAREYFRTLMDDVPFGFLINRLDVPPAVSISGNSDPAKCRFGDVLCRVLDALPFQPDATR